jgi:hypothetical protein
MLVAVVVEDIADLLAAMVAQAVAEVVGRVRPQLAPADQTVVLMEHPLQEEPVVQMLEVVAEAAGRRPCPAVLGVLE